MPERNPTPAASPVCGGWVGGILQVEGKWVGGLLGGGWAVVLVAGAWESFSVAWGSPRLIEDDCAGPWRNASPFLLAFGGVQVP